MAFIRGAAEREALPDFAWRVVGESSVAGLGSLGNAALSGATVGEGLAQVAQAMPNYCTHERFAFVEDTRGGSLEVAFSIKADPAAVHHALLYTLALVASFCAAGQPDRPFFNEVALPPLPRTGLGHIPTGIARSIRPAFDDALRVTLLPAVLRTALPRPGPVAAGIRSDRSSTVQEEAGFLGAARMLVAGMVADGQVSVERLAAAAGVIPRTLQRRLAAEGTSFSALVDEARRKVALAQIAQDAAPVGEIAAALGYSSSSALTRAVRRWTDIAPRDLRRSGRAAASAPGRGNLSN
jgi:AraC-like DNA-binding protein